jgi:hypothetical protein
MAVKLDSEDDEVLEKVSLAQERVSANTTAGGGGHGDKWRPEAVIMPHTAGRSGVPTIDDDLDADPHAAPLSYPAWRSEDTFVVTRYREQYGTRREARKAIEEQFGPVLEERMAANKWCFRVYKPTSKR